MSSIHVDISTADISKTEQLFQNILKGQKEIQAIRKL